MVFYNYLNRTLQTVDGEKNIKNLTGFLTNTEKGFITQ